MRALALLLLAVAALAADAAVETLNAQQIPPEITRALRRRLPASMAIDNQTAVADQTTEKVSEKVVGGRDAERGQFKWQVALILASAPKDDPFKGHFCGGSLVAWRWVLTAAHCLFVDDPAAPDKLRPVRAEEVDIYLGSHNFIGGQRLRVARIVTHESYDTDTQDNDIALIELSSEPQGRQSLELMPLAPATQELNTRLTVVGWGSTARGVVPPEKRQSIQTLQYLDDVRVREASQCNQHLVRSLRTRTAKLLQEQGVRSEEIRTFIDSWYPSTKQLVTRNMFCAGGAGGGDSCFGDSGGPLVVRARRTLHQVGIVSWGPAEGCGLTSLYGVYTRLANYRAWISRTTAGAVP
ncbi:MAG: serine protease [Hyphomicrobiaceae bacterium]|nr:serine protease [Hyphomicrobiaceae bacterium]